MRLGAPVVADDAVWITSGRTLSSIVTGAETEAGGPGPTGSDEAAEVAPTSTTPDLLPGVDLVTEEVAPGVYWVLSDGHRGLRQNVSDVAVSPEGDVWVIKSDARLARLGEPGTHDGEGKFVRLVAASDGALVLVSQQRHKVFDGKRWARWVPTRKQGCSGAWTDGACWTIDSGSVRGSEPTPRVIRSDRHGAERSFSEAEIGMGPDEGLSAIVASDDGTVWLDVFATNTGDGWDHAGFARFDGETWSRVPPPTGSEFNRPRDIAIDADNVVWLATLFDGKLVLERWDGEAWSSFETSDYRFGPTYYVIGGRF